MRFEPGDRVSLKGPHVYDGTVNPLGSPVKSHESGVVVVPIDSREYLRVDHVCVQFDNYRNGGHSGKYWVQEDALVPEKPSPEEIETTIKSIQEAM